MRKAQLTDEMRNLIIAVVIIVVILSFFFGVRKVLTSQSERTACKASVRAQSAAGITSEIDCPADDLLVDNRNVQQAKFEVAESMRRCWDNFWQGEVELFSGEGIFCSVCSVIEFKDKSKHLDGFTGYLMRTKIPNQDITYMDFLQNRRNPLVQELYDNPALYDKNDPKLQNELDASRLHSVIFVYARGEKWTRELQEWFGSSTVDRAFGGGVAGLAAGIGGAALAVVVLGVNPFGWVVLGGVGIAALSGAALTSLVPTEPPETLALAALVDYDEQELKDIGCTYLPVRAFGK